MQTTYYVTYAFWWKWPTVLKYDLQSRIIHWVWSRDDRNPRWFIHGWYTWYCMHTLYSHCIQYAAIQHCTGFLHIRSLSKYALPYFLRHITHKSDLKTTFLKSILSALYCHHYPWCIECIVNKYWASKRKPFRLNIWTTDIFQTSFITHKVTEPKGPFDVLNAGFCHNSKALSPQTSIQFSVIRSFIPLKR